MLSLYKFTFLFLFDYRNLRFLLIFLDSGLHNLLFFSFNDKRHAELLVLHVSIHTGRSESIGCLVFVH